MIIVYIVHNKVQEPIGDLCATPDERLAVFTSGSQLRTLGVTSAEVEYISSPIESRNVRKIRNTSWNIT